MKTELNNLSPDVGARVNTLVGQHRFFVDITNGNDLNDGKTAAKAFKTLTKLSSSLSGKHHVYTHVTIAAGAYPEGLAIYDTTGNIYIAMDANTKIQGPSLAKNTGTFSPVYIANNSTNITIANGQINAVNSTDSDRKQTGTMVYCNNTTSLSLVSVHVDGALALPHISVSGVSAYGSNVMVRLGSIKNCAYPLLSGIGGILTTSDTTFSGNTVGYFAQNAGIMNIKAPVGTKPLKAAGSPAYSLNDIEAGTIVEVGSNVNGVYYKYSNGLLLCAHTLSISGPNVATGSLFRTPPVAWTFPHKFKDHNVIISGTPAQGTPLTWLSLEYMATTSVNAQLCAMSPIASTIQTLLPVQALGSWY